MSRFILMIFVLISMPQILLAQEWGNLDKLLRHMQSPHTRLESEAGLRARYRSLWNGRGGTFESMEMFLSAPEGRQALNLTETQADRLAYFHDEEQAMRRGQNIPGLAELEAEADKILEDNPYLENATEEQKKRYGELAESASYLMFDDVMNEVETVLSPEQMLQIREVELQLLPEIGLPSPAMFESLGLTDEQKEKMAAIKKQMEQEFEKLLSEVVAVEHEIHRQLAEKFTALCKENPPASFEEFMQKLKSEQKKLNKNAEVRKKRQQVADKGKLLATRLKFGLMNVLTDEQLDKMQRIIENMPEFIKAKLAELRREREEMEKSDQWTPGPNSWRPGDGTPEEFKRRRIEKAFPQTEMP